MKQPSQKNDKQNIKIPFTCLDILPQSFETVLREKNQVSVIMNTLLLAIDFLIKSQKAFFIDRDYHFFDPHVGENSCQIRAALLAIIAKTYQQNSSQIQEKVKAWESKKTLIKEKLEAVQRGEVILKGASIVNQLSDWNLLFIITEFDKFLFHCFFLTVFKKHLGANHTAINYAALASFTNLSTKAAKKLARYYQIDLSRYCCDSIVLWTQEIGFPYKHVNSLRQLQQIDDDGRCVLPCFFAMEILIEKMKRLEIPILLVLNNSHRTCAPLLLRFDYDVGIGRYRFHAFLANSNNSSEACFVVHAETGMSFSAQDDRDLLIRHIEKKSLTKILLAYMAIHPQYGGKRLSQLAQNPLLAIHVDPLTYQRLKIRYFRARKLGFQIGCHHANKAFIFVEHIFCDTFAQQEYLQLNQSKQHAFVGNLMCWEAVPNVI